MMHVARCPYAGCETHVIVWDDRSEGRHYTVDMTNPTSPVCQCEAYRFGLDCKHAVAAMEWWMTQHGKEAEVTDESRAVVPHEGDVPAPMAMSPLTGAVAENADRIRMALAPYIAGATTYVEAAQFFMDAGLVSWPSPQAGALVLMKAAELGIPATMAADYIDVLEFKKDGRIVSRRPYLRGRMSGALVNRYCASIGRDGTDGITITQQSEDSVTGMARRGDRTETLTLTRAQFSHLKSSTWRDYPMDMLVAKVQSRLAAQLFPDILGGMQAVMAHGQRLDIVRDVAPTADPVTGEIVDGEVVEVEALPEPAPDDARLCVACDEVLAPDEQEVCARCGAPPDAGSDSATTDEAQESEPVDDDDIPVGDDLPPGYDEGDPVDDEPATEVDAGDATVPALRKRRTGEKHAALTAADFMAVSRMVQAFDFPEGMGAVRLIRGWPTTDDGRPKPINKEAVTEWCVTYAKPGQGLDMIAHELTILQANR